MMFIAVSDNQQFGATSRSEVEQWAARNVAKGSGREVWIWMYEKATTNQFVTNKPTNGQCVGLFVTPEAA
jgi:hypothetical protein